MEYKVLRYAAAAFLLVGALDMPYGYYRFLKLAVFIAAAFYAYKCYEKKQESWLIGFAVILILFNPLFSMSFSKEIWRVLDIASGAFFLASARFQK